MSAPVEVPDIYTVVVTVALSRTATGAPADFEDVTVIVAADNDTQAQLVACQMATGFADAVMPVASRITHLIC